MSSNFLFACTPMLLKSLCLPHTHTLGLIPQTTTLNFEACNQLCRNSWTGPGKLGESVGHTQNVAGSEMKLVICQMTKRQGLTCVQQFFINTSSSIYSFSGQNRTMFCKSFLRNFSCVYAKLYIPNYQLLYKLLEAIGGDRAKK
jgi:hypothetical protein